MTAIIILNWNGSTDTIECLQSLQHVQEDYFCVVADNGSHDNSIRNIEDYLQEAGTAYRTAQHGERLKGNPENHEVIIYKIEDNLGFAKGNNEAIRFISSASPDHYLLLNNDTIVEPSFLQGLLYFANKHPHIKALTPLICYHYDHNIVWNAGGKQFCGFRKYFYAKKPVKSIKETDHIMVTFLTGCALFFSPAILREDGGIFTEDFFFGEEDFNFCLQMNKRKQPMACVLASKIYHKVSASVAKHNSLGKIYIYYLNRFIDIRLNTTPARYWLWSRFYAIYVIMLLYRKHVAIKEILPFVRRLLKEAQMKNSVTQQDFAAATIKNG